VVRMPGGRPTMKFHGRAGEIAAKLGMKNAALSISHTSEQAIAQVILEG
jgi:holo-[acyl-carrier protein] synthase